MSRVNYTGTKGKGRGHKGHEKSPRFRYPAGCGSRATMELAVVAGCDRETAARFMSGSGEHGGLQWRSAIALARACKQLGIPLPAHVQITKGGPLLAIEKLLEST